MHRHLNKFLPMAASCIVALPCFVKADEAAQIRSLENRVTALEQRKGVSGMVNPPANPHIKNGLGLFFFGELLYWKATETGLPLAVVNKDTSANLADANIKNFQGKWDLGVRAGIGYVLPHDGWDVNLTWLHFNTSSYKQAIHASSDKFIFPSLTNPADPIAMDNDCRKANGHWKLFFNQLDLDLGREFFVSKWLTLRPHAGIRADWLVQKLKADYENFEGGISSPNEVESRNKDRWWGAGIEGGLDTQWGFGSGWSIFADIAAAILYGEHSIKCKDEDNPPHQSTPFSSLPNGEFEEICEHLRIAHAVLDLQIGLRWDMMVFEDHVYVGVQAGWENHIYFNQNQFPYFTSSANLGNSLANQGDLSLQGWTFGARVDF